MTYLWTKPSLKRAIISKADYSAQGFRRTILPSFKHIPGICRKLGFNLAVE
ncbi:hypothetical protein [Pantoea eucrina]|uniref:hypothetical protein n=1 Tax=Pantoea eucrina TaxID=472693 RepID=UPI0014288BF3|nr:hypothetical protein [Pantoea eucrina]